MKKFLSLRGFAILLTLLTTIGLCAQTIVNTPIQLNGSSCSYFSQFLLQIGPATNPALSSSLMLGGAATNSYSFLSGTAIKFSANSTSSFHVGANAGAQGNFHAQILNQDLPATFIAPSNLNAVPEFSKVEIGVDLSNITGLNFDSRVSAFLNDDGTHYKPGTTGYAGAYQSQTILNPYDPDHISVDAVFFRPGGGPNQTPLIRYGFYYKNFMRTAPSDNRGWIAMENQIDEPEWRIRVAPDELGVWSGFINVWVDGAMLPQTYSFSFTVVASSNPGYVQIDPQHPHYLKFSGDGSTYFPIGDNYCWPWESHADDGALNYDSPYGFPNDHRMYPSVHEELTEYLGKLTCQDYGGGGGNATRLSFVPWGFEVEREKLNNYETRQIEMWELDDYINSLEEKGVYVAFTLGGGGDISEEAGEPTYSERWNWDPFNTPSATTHDPFKNYKGISGVDDPQEFFTNTTCKEFYKKRLRYIVSRWGYSTAISMWELIGEVNGAAVPVQNPYDVYMNDATFAQNVANWYDEMYDYIRNSLWDPHLRTASFKGNEYHPNDNGSYLWSKTNVDIISAHIYEPREIASRLENETFIPAVRSNTTFGNKPLLCGEHDVWNFDLVTCSTDWSIHNKHWASIFSGTCGSGLSWLWFRYWDWAHAFNNGTWNYSSTTPYDGEYERNNIAMRSFVSLIDFQDCDYIPYTSYRNPYTLPYPGNPIEFESFYLTRADQHAAYGWTHNRSFNLYTCDNFANSFTENNATYNSTSDVLNSPYVNNSSSKAWYWRNGAPQYGGLLPTPHGFYPEDDYQDLFGTTYNSIALSQDPIYIEHLLSNTKYVIRWYWTWGTSGGQYAGYTSSPTTDANGILTVIPPPTGTVNNVDYPGDWAFIATVVDDHRLAAPTPTNTNLFVTASPNPSTGIFTLQADLSDKHTTLEVRSLDGRLVLQTETNMLNGYRLDLGKEAEGVYILTVRRDDQVCTTRLMKTAE